MKNPIVIEARCFPVVLKNLNGETVEDYIVLGKHQLQAAQIVGQSSKELIHRLYNREGFHVIDIGTPVKKSVTVDLTALWGRKSDDSYLV